MTGLSDHPGRSPYGLDALTRSTLSTQFSPRPPALRFHGDGTRDCGAAPGILLAEPRTKRRRSRRGRGEVASRASAGDAQLVWRFIMEAISVRPTSDGVLWCGGDRTRLFAGFSTKSVTRTGRSLPGLSSGLPPSSRIVPMPNQLVRPRRFPRSRRSRWSAPSPSSHRSGDALCSSLASPPGTRARRARPRATPAPALYPPCWR